MKRIRFFCLIYILFDILISGSVFAVNKAEKDLKRLFSTANTTYVIKHSYVFSETIHVPANCELKFKGGKITGPIKFDNTLLSGDVNLRGSTISGTLKNRVFNALWLCVADGINDDARRINDILGVCNHIFFPKGKYLLVSRFDPIGKEVVDKENKPYHKIKAHIGVNKSNVSLIGEGGTEFITSAEITTICAYTKPYQIQESIHDLVFENIKFTVNNDGKAFHQWMHTLKLIGVNNVRIKACVFNDFYGDAICLDHYGDNPATGERTRNQNVKILNNIIIGGPLHNNRNGISVINGKHVLIKDNLIRNTSRDDMPGGIDVEPNNSAYTIEDVRIEKNVLEGIRGKCGAISIMSAKDGPVHEVSIVGNRISKSHIGIYVAIATRYTTDNIKIIGNCITHDTFPYQFIGSGCSKNWVISDNSFRQSSGQIVPGDIKVKNLVQRNNIIGK